METRGSKAVKSATGVSSRPRSLQVMSAAAFFVVIAAALLVYAALEALLDGASLLVIPALALTAGIIGWVLAGRAVEPVRRLTAIASRIAAGERGLRTVVGGPRELAEFSAAFDGMTAQLQDSLREMERRFAGVKQTEEALRISEERLRLALDGTSDGIWDWDVRTGQTYFSPRYYTMLGYVPDEFPPSYESWLERLHPDDAQAAEEAVRRSVEAHVPFVIEFRFKKKNGEWCWLLGRGKVVESDENGNAVRVAGSHTDITERKQAEVDLLQEKLFSDTLIHAMPGILCVFDEQQRFVRWNRRFEEIGGYTGEEIRGMGPTDFFVGEDSPRVVGKIKEALTQGQAETEADFVTKDRRSIPYHFKGVRFSIDGKPHLLGIGVDITERRRSEEALERRIAALTRPLDAEEGIAFEDLYDLSEIQRLQDLYAEAFGVAALITRPDGTPITQPSNFCELCGRFIRTSPVGLKNCMHSDAMIGMHNPAGPNIMPCLSAGLCNAGVSITVGGHHVANWLIGQVRNENQKEEEIMEYARELGADEDAFRAAYREVPVMSQEQFDKLAHVLFELANQISRAAYQNVQQARFIAEYTRSEEQRKEISERFQTVFQEAPMGINIVFPDGRYVDANDYLLKALGYSLEEIRTKTVFDITHPDDRSDTDELADQLRSGRMESYEMRKRYLKKDGGILWGRLRTRALRNEDGELRYCIGIIEDITEQHQAQQHTARLLQAIESTVDGIGIADMERDVIYMNHSLEIMSGYGIEELNEKGGPPALYAEHDLAEQAISGAFEGRAWRGELTLVRKDGKTVPIEISTDPIFDEAGNLIGAIGTHRDISERKAYEGRLRKYEQMVSASSDQMVMVGRGLFYEAANKKALEYVGWSREDLVGRAVGSAFTDESLRAQGLAALEQAFAGETVNYQRYIDYPHLGRRYIDVWYSPVLDEQGGVESVVINARDLTENKKLEEQLMQSQRIESLGTLAGGVAHEINNPINGIMNYAQLIMDRAEEGSPSKEFAGEIIHETQRVAGIVRNLLTFARHEKQAHSPGRMEDIVASVLSLIQTVMRHDQIDLHIEIQEGLPKFKCRSQQIQQVLMNLMTNARDALNERYPEYSPEKRLSVSARLLDKAGKRFIRTTVEDTGMGIAPEIRDRIFDPFFTTKPKETGTGLGLSISYGIVRDHHGELTIESEAGRYTRFHMDLPVDNGWTLS